MATHAELLQLGVPVVVHLAGSNGRAKTAPLPDESTQAALSAAACAFSKALEEPTTELAPTRQDLPAVPGAFVIRNAFSPEEAFRLAEAVTLAHGGRAKRTVAEQRRESQHHRAVTASLEILGRRLRPLLPSHAGPSCNAKLEAPGAEISSFLRCYRYQSGDLSRPHWDRSFCLCETPNVLSSFSAYSLLLYTNDTFEGGETTFFEADPSLPVSNKKLTPQCDRASLRVALRMQPKAGDALLFPHGLHPGCHPSPLHEGSEVLSGEKLLVRTDIMYRVGEKWGCRGEAASEGNEADSSPLEVSPTDLQEEDDATLSDDEAEDEPSDEELVSRPNIQPTFLPGKIKVMQRQQADGEEIPKSSGDEDEPSKIDPSRLPLEERERYYMEVTEKHAWTIRQSDNSDKHVVTVHNGPLVLIVRPQSRVWRKAPMASLGIPAGLSDPLGDRVPGAMDESEHLLKLRALLAPKAQDEAPTKKRKVEEVEGPDWTSRYCVVDAAAALTPLDALAVPLAAPMAEALKKNGFDPLFPIQAMVIPLLLKSAEAADDEDSAYCCDVCVAAPTGQGKTLAYAVPIVASVVVLIIGCSHLSDASAGPKHPLEVGDDAERRHVIAMFVSRKAATWDISIAIITIYLALWSAQGAQCAAPNLTGAECFDTIVNSWLPTNKVLCGQNFGLSNEEFSLDLPAFELANNFTRRGSDLWLDDEDQGLKTWVGCGNHPGLVNGSSYCAQTSSTIDLGTILGDWGVLEGLTPVACLAYSLQDSALSVSFDPPLSTEFILPAFPVVLKLFGYTFAPDAEVPLLDYIGADLQLKTGEALKTHLAFSGVVELAFGIPFIFELVLPVEGVFGMYLDFGGSTLAEPYKVMESLVKFSNEVTLQWGVVIQVSLRPQLAVLGFEFNFPVSAKFQVLWKTGAGSLPNVYLSGTLYHATSLSELIGGLPDLGVVCTIDFFPNAVRESPFCNGDDTMEDEPEVGLYFTVENGKSVADIRAWGMWLAMKVDSSSGSLTLCKDGECSQEFCVWDSQCIEGYHCCKTNFEFTCQKIYRHRLFATDISCLELPAAQAVGLAVDPADGKLEGEECTLDSDCGIGLHCCIETGDPYCRKIQELSMIGLQCSCLIAASGACEEAASVAPQRGGTIATLTLAALIFSL
eukprot:s568_g21.t2